MNMTWKPDRGVLEKEKGEQPNSVLEARAVFLSSLLDLQPDIATHLWTSAFGEFLYVVSDRFNNELIGEQASSIHSGGQVFAHLFSKLNIRWKRAMLAMFKKQQLYV
jgi:hypothetical protein